MRGNTGFSSIYCGKRFGKTDKIEIHKMKCGMARTSATQLAASLFINGDPLTRKRITNITELSKITGVSRPHLQHAKEDEGWQGQADKITANMTVGFQSQ